MQHQRNPLLSVSQKIQLLYIKHPPAERNQDENEEEYQNSAEWFSVHEPQGKRKQHLYCIYVFCSGVVFVVLGEKWRLFRRLTSLLPESKRAKHAYNVCGENNCHENNGIIIITIII